MPLDKELKGTAGKDVGKQIPRVAQDKDEAVEFPQLGMLDRTPICLRLFRRQKGKLMIGLRYLFTEPPRILDHRRVANLYSPRS